MDDPITDVPVIESEEFYGVFESRIGNISLLYNAEMDGLDSRQEIDLSETDLDKLKFVELKTCCGPSDNRHCRWWAQSYLASISNICVGYRTREGIITRIENLRVDMLKNQKQVIPKLPSLKSYKSVTIFSCKVASCLTD